MSASEEQRRGPVIKDRRRIDPATGQPRQATAQPAGTDQDGAGQAPRAAGQARPGKHAVSKPGGSRTEAAGPGSAGPDAANAGEGGPDQAGAGPGQQRASDGEGGAAKATQPELAVKLAERTADLQRVQAEYANYRKRVERDRAAVREHALASVLSELLPVLDDIGRAREHGELNGGFKAVAEALEAAAAKLGLTTFGESGEPFDPKVHEALMHSYSADVTEPTCVQILQPGYQVAERILRPARVAVAEPTDPSGARTVSEDTGAGRDESEAGEERASTANAENAAEAGTAEAAGAGATEAGAAEAAGAGAADPAAGTDRGSDDSD